MIRPVFLRPLGAFFLMWLIASCGGQPAAQPTVGGNNNPPTQPTSAPAATQTLPLNAQGQPLVAKVNNVEITLDDFQSALALYQSQHPAAADELALKQTVLDTMINQLLMEQVAATQGLSVTDSEVDAELQSYKATQTQESWQAWLAENHFSSETEFRASLRDALLTTRMRDQVTQNVGGTVPQVHARHILVDTEAQANDVMRQLSAGADFAALAAQYSKDVTTKDLGGDLGWFTQDTLTEPILTQTAFSLQPGEIAGPIPTTIGFDILQTLERADRPLSPEAQADMARDEMDKWLQSLAQQATIERYL